MTTLRKEVLEKYQSSYFFETGTSDGSGVRLALSMSFEKIFSIEINEILYIENVNKFQKEIESGRLYLFLGDTIEVMQKILHEHIDKKTTFWLDAHVNEGPKGIKMCPLYEELDFIKSLGSNEHTILIDDVRCFSGADWGESITLNSVENKLKEINPSYNIMREHGYVEYDVLVAHL